MEIEQKVFKFDDNEIKNNIVYGMRLLKKMNKSFRYVSDKLTTLGFHYDFNGELDEIDLDELKWNDGKNYKWLSLTNKNVQLIIRSYGSHHTIFTKLIKTQKLIHSNYDKHIYGAFIFNTVLDKVNSEFHDMYVENPYHDLNKALKQIFEQISKGLMHLFWNDLSLIRPKHSDVNIIFINEEIYSIDKIIFCAEELSN